MFSGINRYNALEGRLKICAVQADNIHQFWSLLLNKMRWSIHPKRFDRMVIDAISQKHGDEILKVIASETPSVITIARMLHDQEKSERRGHIEDEETLEYFT